MPLPDNLYELSTAELLNRLWGCQSSLRNTRGEGRNLLWDEILELQRELRCRALGDQ
jgi:hypothetical protein